MTWREYIHPTHHPYVEKALARYKRKGISVEWDTVKDCWIVDGTTGFHTLSAVDVLIRNGRIKP